MKILIACEFSGIVREAFRLRGHDAISVDLLSIPGQHFQPRKISNKKSQNPLEEMQKLVY